MCVASPNSPRRRTPPISHVDENVTHSSDKSCSLKQRTALHEDLPKTVSIGSSNSSNNSRSSHGDSTARSNLSRAQSAALCPVTGRLSNVLDDYVVFPKVLGEGHYGTVRECLHRITGQVLAIKSVEKSKISRLDHLQREIYLLANIDHEHIIKMVDCYEDVDYVHIITEKYTGGEVFDDVIESTTARGCYSEAKTASIIKSLLEAVAYLHDNGIVHRDIKPENLLYETEKQDAIKLIDFGLSRQHKKGEAPMSNPVGTAYYMSPELLKGKYDKSCDVWSVGTIAYILLCGYPPFNGDTDPDIFDNIKKGRFDFPDPAWSNKSDMVKDFIKCLLRRDPRKRFTAKEALMHPWVVSLGETKQEKVQESVKDKRVRYLRIP